MTPEPATAIGLGFFQRLSGIAFGSLCAASSVVGAALLFLIFGLAADGFGASPGVLTLAAIGGLLIGLVTPIMYLVRERRGVRVPTEEIEPRP